MNSELKVPLATEFPKITTRNFHKLVFQAELPEQFLRSLPAETLYLAVKGNGLSSSADLIEIASLEQCRLLLDFDCWHKWNINEDNIWEWLALTDASDGLEILQKIFKCIDLKIIAILLAQYVEYRVFDEPSDLPPGENFYTPDKGYTWISIKIENSEKHFLLGRLLALIYETDAHLFSQLLSVASTNTPSVLEEEAYQDRIRRLSAEGIPDSDSAFQINQPISERECLDLLKQSKSHPTVIDIQSVSPLLYDRHLLQPLDSLLSDLSIREDFECELTFILNAAIVHHGIDFSDITSLQNITSSVKGGVNIGLQAAALLDKREISDLFKALGLQKIYRLGLNKLSILRKLAISIKKQFGEEIEKDLNIKSVVNLATQMPPRIPMFLKGKINSDPSSDEVDRLSTNSEPVETINELNGVIEYLNKIQK